MRGSSFLSISKIGPWYTGERENGKGAGRLLRKVNVLKLRSLAAAPEGALMTSILGMPEGMP